MKVKECFIILPLICAAPQINLYFIDRVNENRNDNNIS